MQTFIYSNHQTRESHTRKMSTSSTADHHRRPVVPCLSREPRNFFSRFLAAIACFLAAFIISPVNAAVVEGPIYNPATGSMYYLLTQNTWTSSQTEAQALGGHLATVQNQAEQSWIFRTFGIGFGGRRLLWIGLNDIASEGTFRWSSGETSAYRAWAPGEPNNSSSNEDYVALYYQGHSAQGLWNDWPNLQADPIGIPFMGVVEIYPNYRNVYSLDFETLTGMNSSPGPVPESAYLNDQFLSSHGVRFSSASEPAVAVRLGANHATSGLNGFAAMTNSQLNYSAPVHLSFWTPQDPTLAATADFFSVRLDLLGGGTGPVRITAFDLAGQVISSKNINDVGGRVLSLTVPRMHRVVIQGNGTVAFDDLVFANLTPSRPSLRSHRQGDMVRIAWPAGFFDWNLQFTTDPEPLSNWLPSTFPVEFNGEEFSIRMPAESSQPYFFRLIKSP